MSTIETIRAASTLFFVGFSACLIGTVALGLVHHDTILVTKALLFIYMVVDTYCVKTGTREGSLWIGFEGLASICCLVVGALPIEIWLACQASNVMTSCMYFVPSLCLLTTGQKLAVYHCCNILLPWIGIYIWWPLAVTVTQWTAPLVFVWMFELFMYTVVVSNSITRALYDI